MKQRQGQKGFTLIELMIVVAIIGVLSAIAIPAYKDYVSKSQAASALATLKSLVTPAELIIQEQGEISGAISLLGISTDSNTLGTLTIENKKDIKFVFDGGNLNAATMTMVRDATTGWSCKKTGDKLTAIVIEGCSN